MKRRWQKGHKRRYVRRMAAELNRRLPLRLHMTIILCAVVAFGVVASRLLLEAGVASRGLRWGLGVAIAYAFFLACVRLWLDRIHPEVEPRGRQIASEAVNDTLDIAGSPVGEILAEVSGPSSLAPPAPRPSGRTSFAGGGKSGRGGGGFDVPDIDNEGAAAIAIIVVVISLLVAATIFIVQAPTILGEAGADALLAVSLRRRVGRAQGTGWLGGVVKRTILVALAVLAIAAIAGVIVDASEAEKRQSPMSLPVTVPRRPGSPSR